MSITMILPGLFGSSEGHWQRIWAAERSDSRVIEQEDWDCPNLRIWRDRLEQEIFDTRDDVVLLGHSLGCHLAASLARSPAATRVRAAVLVAPCEMTIVNRLHPCTVNPPPISDQRLPFPSLVIGSLNDSYMDLATLQQHARHWGSQTTVIGNAGHINIASGFGRWGQGYRIFDHFLAQAANRKGPARRPDIPWEPKSEAVEQPFGIPFG